MFNNCGNYKSFGDSKFVPQIPESKFKQIIQASESYTQYAEVLDNLWNSIAKEVYFEENPLKQIGFPDAGGHTSYYSSNITSEDAKFIDEFC